MSEATVEEQIAAKVAGTALNEPAPAEAETETAEQAGEPAGEGQARNADGTFAATEPVVETPLLAGKYKTADELEKAHIELQSLLGRQANELGDARALRDEIAQLRETIQKPAQQTYDPGSIDEYLAANPQDFKALAEQAIQTGDNYLYQHVLDAWGDHNRVGAMDFHANAVADAKIAALREEIAPALKVTADVQSTNAFGDAFTAAKTRLPEDFAQVMDGITPENAKSMKTVIDILATGDQTSREAALETLYWSEKGRQAGNLTQHAQQAQQQVATDALQARQEAAVASTTGSQDRVPVSGVDLFHQQFQGSDAFKKYSGQT